MPKSDYWNVVFYDRSNDTYAVYGHNMSGVEAEDKVNELREQRLPALYGRQKGRHEGSHDECKKCDSMMQVMAPKIRKPKEVVETMASGRRSGKSEASLAKATEALKAGERVMAVSAEGSHELVLCRRCQKTCKMPPPPSKEARMIRFATNPNDGLCPCCVTTHFLQNDPRVAAVVDTMVSAHGARAFLMPHLQKQFGTLLTISNSDIKLAEVDWHEVVEKWDLPWPATGRHKPNKEAEEEKAYERKRREGRGPQVRETHSQEGTHLPPEPKQKPNQKPEAE